MFTFNTKRTQFLSIQCSCFVRIEHSVALVFTSRCRIWFKEDMSLELVTSLDERQFQKKKYKILSAGNTFNLNTFLLVDWPFLSEGKNTYCEKFESYYAGGNLSRLRQQTIINLRGCKRILLGPSNAKKIIIVSTKFRFRRY